MSFRRAYDADYLSFDVEKTLASWTEKSQKLGTPQDFFNTPLAETFGINKDGEQPAPDADSGKEESKEPPKEEGAEPR
jgi:hypothetical protein